MNKVCHHRSTLSPCALGSSLGIVFAAINIAIIFIRIHLDLPSHMIHIAGAARIGADMSFIDLAFCIVWSITTGFAGGALIAALYNFIVRRCSCKYCCKPACCTPGAKGEHTCCPEKKCEQDKVK